MNQFNFIHLNNEIREIMLAEMEIDIEAGKFYISSKLNDAGVEAYPIFLADAIKKGDSQTLQEALENAVYFNSFYLRQGKQVKMPSNAALLLAQGEYNRYYIRAICISAIQNNIDRVEVYRARESSWSRPESELKIGLLINAKELLEDLRISIGSEPQILPEVNSGLSVKILS